MSRSGSPLLLCITVSFPQWVANATVPPKGHKRNGRVRARGLNVLACSGLLEFYGLMCSGFIKVMVQSVLWVTEHPDRVFKEVLRVPRLFA